MVIGFNFYKHVTVHDDQKLAYYKERFSEDDVESAFLFLLATLEALWDDVDIEKLKKFYIRDIRLSDELKAKLKKATNLDETFDLLSGTPFCSWLEITILKRMARTADVPEATRLIEIFEECVYGRKCSEVIVYFKKLFINPDHLTAVNAKLNKNPEHLLVADLIRYCHKLETVLNLPTESKASISFTTGCLEICFLIPTHCCSHAYEIAKRNFFDLRSIYVQYLQIGTLPKLYTVSLSQKRKAKCLLKSISLTSNCKFVYTISWLQVIECICI